ncbi:PREDICTED: heat shock-related 70 kDa protein 2-like [Chrysochloris asiatica]|uniref:Heat shock-related 70 kDa protein 2-like n=1 Tax=Chrysochloris asiatica TaxID=185453 RepID=A0A9B0WWN9_CHRAS|nr:PREDICTED: heat shock-related 70 kDa protein 2-like [Chrysochloris asiatica]
MVLSHMKELAEAYLGKKAENAAISGLVCFGDSESQVNRDAGAIAGFNIVRTMYESAAAAMIYDLDRKEKYMLFFDVVDCPLDVSILNSQDVRVTSGDIQVAGEDLDSHSLSHLTEEF